MKLKPIKGQEKHSLLDFYNPEKWPTPWGKMPEMMCKLIKRLEITEHEAVWVFTSHDELLFTNRDDHKEWQVLVKVVKLHTKQFFKVTAAQKSPWHHLTGFAENHELAAELVISGLSVSGNGRERNIFMDSN